MKSFYRPIEKNNGKYGGYGWFHVPSWNITIGAAPKAGSSSIKRFMESNMECSFIPQNQVRGPCVFVIRDPVSRFCSLWRSKCRDKRNIVNRTIYGMSPSELMDYIERGGKDVHWTPQYKLIGNLTPQLIPLERLSEWWTYRGFGKLDNHNTTEGLVDINPKRIVDYYWQDMELYTNAIMSYDATLLTDLTEKH